MVKMNTKNIDTLNLLLIVISLILAIKLPFELFLFSYAVLGPLHYLTEINWLNKKSFFIKNPIWIWPFILLAFLFSIPTILNLSIFNDFPQTKVFTIINQSLALQSNLLILIAFLFAIGILYLEKLKEVLLFFAFCIFFSFLIQNAFYYVMVIVFFMPTIIHVYVFTLLFMIFGTINKPTNTGIIAIIILILSPLLIFLLDIEKSQYLISTTTQANFMDSSFSNLSVGISRILGYENGQFNVFSPIGVKIQIFIAFCYTYHYLNWFSKTWTIGWNKSISKPKLYSIIVFWIASVLLYYYNYKTGFAVLLLLSVLHVLLEFPLNIISIKGIFQKITNKTS